MVMISVNIAVLKAKLSYYLGQVRRGGEVLVLDRKTPVARVVPADGREEGLALVEASKSPASLAGLRIPPPRRETDSLRLLREERGRR